MKFKILDKVVVYDGFLKIRKFKIQHELFNGEWGDVLFRESISQRDAVAVLIHDPLNKLFLTIKQFRIGAIGSSDPWVYELVGGLIEKKQSSKSAAIRESFEEAHVEISNLSAINNYYSSVGNSQVKTTLYYAQTNLSDVGGVYGLKSEGEDILVEILSQDVFRNCLESGIFQTSSLLIAGYWAKSQGLL